MMTKKPRIAEYFIQRGIISETTLNRALEIAAKKKRKIGQVLEEMGVITGPELAAALAYQYDCKIISNIERHSFSRELLDNIPQDTALRHMLFPLKISNRELHVAMADPTDTRITMNIAANNNLTIVPVVATRDDIIAAINKHYLGRRTVSNECRTIMIAEGNMPISFEQVQKLKEQNYRIIKAGDGIEAFKMALKEHPQVILTDKEMPNFGGYYLIRSIKNVHETRDIAMILMTSSGSEEEEAEAFNNGFFDYLIKPVKDVTLITKIKRAIQAFDTSSRQVQPMAASDMKTPQPEIYSFPDIRTR
jgi:CheY-like chemotaxis protein